MKKTLAMVLALVMLVACIAGCAKTEKPAAEAAAPAAAAAPEAAAEAKEPEEQKEVEVVLWHYPGQYTGYEDDFQAFCDAVTEKYPYIKINAEMLSFDSGPEKFSVALGTGATPDIIADNFSRIAPAAHAGLLVDLTDLIDAHASSFYEGTQRVGEINGEHLIVNSSQSSGYFLCINKNMVERLGIMDMFPADGLHWSYDEFLAMCEAARAADPTVYPVALWGGTRSGDTWYYTWLMTGGTKLLNDEHTATAFNSPEAVKTLDVLKTCVDKGYCLPGAATAKDEELYPLFYSEQVMMLAGGTLQDAMTVYSLMDNDEIEGFEIYTCAMPTPDGKADPISGSFGTGGWSVFKNENDPAKIDACKKIVSMYVEDAASFLSKNASNTGLPTTLVDVQPTYADEKAQKLADWCLDYTSKYAICDFGILEPWWSDFRETFYVELQGLYAGTQTAQEMLDNWQTSANAVIANAQ